MADEGSFCKAEGALVGECDQPKVHIEWAIGSRLCAQRTTEVGGDRNPWCSICREPAWVLTCLIEAAATFEDLYNCSLNYLGLYGVQQLHKYESESEGGDWQP